MYSKVDVLLIKWEPIVRESTCLSIDSGDDDSAHIHANEGLLTEVLMQKEGLGECVEEHEKGVGITMPHRLFRSGLEEL